MNFNGMISTEASPFQYTEFGLLESVEVQGELFFPASASAKILGYLSEEAKKHNSNSFSIPFNRQQLADYLSVDRSAMSNELCKMRDDGMIGFKKNWFTLL